MTYPVAAGSATMSGNYIPEIWSGKTLVKFYDTSLYGSIANTDYEGEIKQKGDTIQIRLTPDIVIKKYVIDQGLTYTKPESSTVELTIDQGYYYAFPINKVEQKQADINFVSDWANDAGEQLAIEIDTDINANVYSDADTNNSGITAGRLSSSFNMGATGTPVALTKVNILDFIVDCGTVLDEQKGIPASNRWAVFSSAICGLIRKSDLQDASFSGDGRSSLKTGGEYGTIDDFKIYKSNNLTTVADTGHTAVHCMAGHKSALSFASQLTENDIVDNPTDFGKLQRGLQVYGYKVLKSTSLIDAYVYKA